MTSPYTTFGAPPDGVAWAALAAAGVIALWLHPPTRARLHLPTPKGFLVPALALGAALLSAGYVAFYLRGGPRIIDATSYFLEARALAKGYLAFPVPAPTSAFRGRFLLENANHELAVIFPPGYPAVLALGFLLHAPLAVGPLIAALLVLATYALARQVSGDEIVARVAAALSLLSAALRYHTADTMSHGFCALLLCTGLFTALRARRFDALVSGFACGWLLATRPVSGIVGVLLNLSLLARTPRRVLDFALALGPGITLLLCHQHAATGSFWHSTQRAYYALADGPPGCFDYGFGPQIGCLFEHGEFVRARLAHGFGLTEALGVTVRRLAIHTIDLANAAPLALLCPVGAWLARRQRGARTLFFGALLLMLAYAPFYFDASYPGGGARLFADVIPLEHVLLAVAIVRLGWTQFALPLSLVGFAVHASFSHRALAERDGGAPMFDEKIVARAGVTHGLVFIDTDHGFDLAHNPGQTDAQRALVYARRRNDALDLLLWQQLGRPPAFVYDREHSQLTPDASLATRSMQPLVFEAESQWPPLSVSRGWIEPVYFDCDFAQHRGLRFHPVGPAGMSLTLELASLDSKPHSLRLHWLREPGGATVIDLRGPNAEQQLSIPAGAEGCANTDSAPLVLGTLEVAPSKIEVQASRPAILDSVEVLP